MSTILSIILQDLLDNTIDPLLAAKPLHILLVPTPTEYPTLAFDYEATSRDPDGHGIGSTLALDSARPLFGLLSKPSIQDSTTESPFRLATGYSTTDRSFA